MVEYRAAAHLGPHTAVVAVAEMMMLSVVLHSGTQSAAGSLAIRAHNSHFESHLPLFALEGPFLQLSAPSNLAPTVSSLAPSGLRLAKFPLTFLHKQHILSSQFLPLPPHHILSVTAQVLSVTTWISSANTGVSPLSQLQFQVFYIISPAAFSMGMAKWTNGHN